MPRVLASLETGNGWLSARLTSGAPEKARLARIANAWERVNAAAREAETYNLDRKPLVFSVFGELAEAARA